MTQVFFYGLFMDEDMLKEQGLEPIVVGPAKLDDFRIRIFDRATLIRESGAEAYGVVMELSDDSLRSLYSGPGVSDYRPEPVDAVLLDSGSTCTSVCYNLPSDRLGSGANEQYAQSLSRLLRKLGFPARYAAEVMERRDD